MAGEPEWRQWALWLALQLGRALRGGATAQDRAAGRRAFDEFSAEIRDFDPGRGVDEPRGQPR